MASVWAPFDQLMRAADNDCSEPTSINAARRMNFRFARTHPTEALGYLRKESLSCWPRHDLISFGIQCQRCPADCELTFYRITHAQRTAAMRDAIAASGSCAECLERAVDIADRAPRCLIQLHFLTDALKMRGRQLGRFSEMLRVVTVFLE